MDKPKVPDNVMCSACGRFMYWCGVHQEWVDGRHRKSHDDEGHRMKHTPVQKGDTR